MGTVADVESEVDAQIKEQLKALPRGKKLGLLLALRELRENQDPAYKAGSSLGLKYGDILAVN